jgi:hypothetical protein
MQKRFKDSETFHDTVPASMNDRKYDDLDLTNHGLSGPLHVGFASGWERDVPSMVEAFTKAGYDINPDHNSGNPLGISISIKSVREGIVSSAQDLIWDTPRIFAFYQIILFRGWYTTKTEWLELRATGNTASPSNHSEIPRSKWRWL